MKVARTVLNGGSGGNAADLHNNARQNPTFIPLSLFLPESMPYFAGENIKTYKLITSCMELTIIETSAHLEMRKQFSLLAVQLEDFRKKVTSPGSDK